MTSIRDWPEDDRPREKLLAQGPQSLSDAELLAIFLRTGVTGKTAVDLARDLLSRFDGLRALLKASSEEFCEAKGLGFAKYAQLQAVLEMARRHLQTEIQGREPLKDPQATRRYLQAQMRDLPHEVFAALFLDNQHRVIAFAPLASGTIDGAAVYPREVVKAALKHAAAAVIFAHNHPSGIAEPSAADRALTDRLKAALAVVDIRVLDHFVVGEGTPVSFAERGWI
jgi:DNA repair protein RadC